MSKFRFTVQVFSRLFVFVVLLIGTSLGSLFAGGGQEVDTQVQLEKAPAYISPGNTDGGRVKLTIENIKLKIDPNATIKSFAINIYNKNGQLIFSKVDEKLEGRGFFAELFNVGEIPQVKVPETITWPGTGNDGKVVPDGEYFYQLTVLDSYGKKTSSPPLSVVVDTKAPSIVSATVIPRVFSPNGDGIRDTIKFNHRTDTAFGWTETVLNQAGATFWSVSVMAAGDTASSDIVLSNDSEWDGIANQDAGEVKKGVTVPEGTYLYRLTGVDRAGNVTKREIPFSVSFKASDLSLTVKDERTLLGAQNPLVFLVSVASTDGLLSWKLEVSDSQDTVVRRFSGQGVPPENVLYNGTGHGGRPESDSSALLRDGSYTVLLSAEYDSGTLSQSDPLTILIDGQAPAALITLDSVPDSTARNQALIFGTSGKEKLSLAIRYDNKEDWTVHLERLDAPSTEQNSDEFQSKSRFEFEFKEWISGLREIGSLEIDESQTSAVYEWDGTLPASVGVSQEIQMTIPDGSWGLYLSSTDKAGNEGESRQVRFIRNLSAGTSLTLEPATFKAVIAARPVIFTPDGDGDGDEVVFELSVEGNATTVDSWVLEIFDPVQESFRIWSGRGLPSETIAWDGKSDGGELVQSALDYPAVLTIVDQDGKKAQAMVSVAVDILVLRDGDKLRIALPNIQFPPDSPDLFKNAQEVLDANLVTLRRLARTLNRFTEHQISVEGHANFAWANSAADKKVEQSKELLPLSSARALEVKQALIILGVAAERLSAVGYGGDFPVVNFDDKVNRWKNRRVEFILTKN